MLVPTLRAQHGEDALLARRFGGKRGGYYVAVGALDGDRLSNTFHFEHALDWTGVLVEADPAQAQRCRVNRPGSVVVNRAACAPGSPPTVQLQVADGQEEFSTMSANRVYAGLLAERGITTRTIDVPAGTLDDILTEAGTQHIDFVTIDVEGHELDVLRGFDPARWRPTVVLLESATGAPHPRIAARLFRAGYGRTRRVVINDWYEQMPAGQRIRSLVATYASAVPLLARLGLRELLRSLGLLDRVRAWRSRR